MRVINLALKDLLQTARDWKMVLFMVVMPIIFTAFFGFIFRGAGDEGDPRLPVGFLDRDAGTVLSVSFRSLLESSDAIRLVILTEDQAGKAADDVQGQHLAAAVVIPAGFSERVLVGDAVSLTVIADAESLAGRTAVGAIQAVLPRLLSSAEIARLSAAASAATKPFESQAAREAYFGKALTLASEAWQSPPLTVRVEQAIAKTEEGKGIAPNSFAHASPGMIIQFTIFGLMTPAALLTAERKSGTLRRLLTTPITKAEIIAAKLSAILVIVFVQQALLVGVGQLAFGVPYLREPLAVLLVMLGLALWCGSLGLLIGAVAKAEEQVIMWALIAMFLFTALGGAWFPLETSGKAFAAIGHLTPAAWAMDGFKDIVIRGLGLSSVWPDVGMLLGYAALFFGLAIWRFRYD